MPRLGHKKSRNGCQQCKTRHVKCDENKPCSSCARHGVQCSLVPWDPNALPPQPVKSAASSSTRVTRAPAQTSTVAALPIEYVLNPSPAPTAGTSDTGSPHSQTDPFPYLTKFVNKCDTVQPNYWVRDLELMHHWTTEAFNTVTERDDIRDMWRLAAPKQAINNTFLMHEILAFSALHLAYQQHDQRRAFYALGIHHQDLAIRAMRKVLQNVSNDNVGALFATSTLVTLSVFGSTSLHALYLNPSSTRPSQDPIEDILDIFALVHGVGGVLSSAQHSIKDGPFAPMTKLLPYETPHQPVFDKVIDHLPDLIAFFEAQPMNEDMREGYLDVLSAFREKAAFSRQPCIDGREIRFLFSWPLHIRPIFFTWLRQRNPGALVILMHYAVVLHAAEPMYWFMNGWACRIMETAEAVDPSWQPALQWPSELIKIQAQQQRQAQQRQEQSAS
ncbi:hypothetical protein BDV95DRAFT_488986 [Massariosphaeria phaeospora]|uniref:Zn(2)-C6 fungal-type domain-containing protein n=1 Tax=Massariosphaeria phaeospora TaxID=100035 RepID=A0A7C8MS58_9PLEO|nr:hypothetical protein BDV95DRAFT_488986 [Massariosphaeria phaeospora]